MALSSPAALPGIARATDGESIGSSIIQGDLSESGALLLVRTSKIAVGDEVKLQLYIADDPGTSRDASARVVRVEELTPGDAGPWLRRVGVQFDAPLTMYAEEIKAFRERAERLGTGV